MDTKKKKIRSFGPPRKKDSLARMGKEVLQERPQIGRVVQERERGKKIHGCKRGGGGGRDSS